MYNIEIREKKSFMNHSLPVILGGFGPGQKCICDKTVAEIHGIEIKHVREMVKSKIARFREDIDIIDLKVVDQTDDNLLLELGYTKMQISKSKNIYIFSERGYLKLVKDMETDLAYEIHDRLVEEYFQLRDAAFTLDDVARLIVATIQPMMQQLINTQKVLLERYLHTSTTTPLPVEKVEKPKDPVKEYMSKIFCLCENICKKSAFENPNDVLSYVYTRIHTIYGYSWDDEKREFAKTNGYIPKSVIGMIARSDKPYHDILLNMLKDMDKEDTPTWDKLRLSIDKLAVKRGDKSLNFCQTYCYLYKRMGVENWDVYITEYHKAHGEKPNAKVAVIKENQELQNMLLKALTKEGILT